MRVQVQCIYAGITPLLVVEPQQAALAHICSRPAGAELHPVSLVSRLCGSFYLPAPGCLFREAGQRTDYTLWCDWARTLID